MKVWVIKAGRFGGFEQFALNNDVVGIDFDLRQSVRDFDSLHALRQVMQSNNAANQLWRFVSELNAGETVVLPCKQHRVVAVGKIVGDYRYEPDYPMPHVRSVEWEAVDIPRSSLTRTCCVLLADS